MAFPSVFICTRHHSSPTQKARRFLFLQNELIWCFRNTSYYLSNLQNVLRINEVWKWQYSGFFQVLKYRVRFLFLFFLPKSNFGFIKKVKCRNSAVYCCVPSLKRKSQRDLTRTRREEDSPDAQQ